MIANKYKISKGVGRSQKYLPSFDKALLDAGTMEKVTTFVCISEWW